MSRPRASQPLSARPKDRRATSEERAAARERRRQELGSRGYRGSEIFAVVPGDPLEHLESMRLAYIAEIEHCARHALLDERAAILLKLLKFTSLGRIRVDVSAQLSKLTPEADLREMTDDQLAAIMRGEAPAIDVTPDENSPSHRLDSPAIPKIYTPR